MTVAEQLELSTPQKGRCWTAQEKSGGSVCVRQHVPLDATEYTLATVILLKRAWDSDGSTSTFDPVYLTMERVMNKTDHYKWRRGP